MKKTLGLVVVEGKGGNEGGKRGGSGGRGGEELLLV